MCNFSYSVFCDELQTRQITMVFIISFLTFFGFDRSESPETFKNVKIWKGKTNSASDRTNYNFMNINHFNFDMQISLKFQIKNPTDVYRDFTISIKVWLSFS